MKRGTLERFDESRPECDADAVRQAPPREPMRPADSVTQLRPGDELEIHGDPARWMVASINYAAHWVRARVTLIQVDAPHARKTVAIGWLAGLANFQRLSIARRAGA